MATINRREAKAEDKRVDQAFNTSCRGIGVDILNIPRVFNHGRSLIHAGADDAALAAGLRTFVLSLAK